MAFSPETIAGIEYTMAGVVTRIFLFIVTAILLYFATKRGAGVVKKTEETLSIVQNNAKVANTISANLNTTIHKEYEFSACACGRQLQREIGGIADGAGG